MSFLLFNFFILRFLYLLDLGLDLRLFTFYFILFIFIFTRRCNSNVMQKNKTKMNANESRRKKSLCVLSDDDVEARHLATYSQSRARIKKKRSQIISTRIFSSQSNFIFCFYCFFFAIFPTTYNNSKLICKVNSATSYKNNFV